MTTSIPEPASTVYARRSQKAAEVEVVPAMTSRSISRLLVNRSLTILMLNMYPLPLWTTTVRGQVGCRHILHIRGCSRYYYLKSV